MFVIRGAGREGKWSGPGLIGGERPRRQSQCNIKGRTLPRGNPSLHSDNATLLELISLQV